MISKLFSDGNIKVTPKAKLSDYTTFQLGGPCESMIHCETPEQLESAVRKLSSDKSPFILIGGGSNIVVSDMGVKCHVIRYYSGHSLISINGNELTVSGCTILDHLVEYAANSGLEGINYCSGIPGTVGGAVVGNAGAFGKQIGDVLANVVLIDKSGNKETVGPERLEFSYRNSNLRDSGKIVLSATLNLTSGSSSALFEERHKILQTRWEKHPDLSKEPCAGSFFRNIEPTSSAGRRQATGWFLDQADGKNLRYGGAYIFSKHANIIVKGQHCSSQDVLELSKKMAALAKYKFNLNLVREVKFVGNFKGKPESKKVIW